MTFRPSALLLSFLLAGSFLVSGCNNPGVAQPDHSAGAAKSNTVPAAPAAQEDDPLVPKVPNPKLQTMNLYVGPKVLKTELALTDLQIRTGMMFRTNVVENEAMLFVFPRPHRAGFWMKNVDIPLDGAYIDPDGVILQIVDMKPNDETTLLADTDRVQFVLETKHGWFKRNGVQPGVLITTERGPLKDVFGGIQSGQ